MLKNTMEQFKTVEKWFSAQASIASSDPYQVVCDNYSDLIRLLNTYSPKKTEFRGIIGNDNENDKMKEVLENIIAWLRRGINICPTWIDYDGVNHFCEVNRNIQIYKQELIDAGYKYD